MTEIDDFIQAAVSKERPATVQQLVQLIQEEFAVSREEAIKRVINLNIRGNLNFKDSPQLLSAKAYPFPKSLWYWVVIGLTIASSASVFVIAENAFPLVYLRYLLGSIFIFFLPGFCLVKVLFPRKELDEIEIGAISIGMSLALVPIVSLLLNYTSWGITTATVTISLLALTTILATYAVLQKTEPPQEE